MAVERTLVLIKPDAIKLGCGGEIMMRFLERGFEIVAGERVFVTPEIIEAHYGKKFLEAPEIRDDVIAFLTSGPVIVLILQRENAVEEARKMIGPLGATAAGTIRGDFPSDSLRSLVHGSDSPEAALYEIDVWFGEKEKKVLYRRFDQLNDAEQLFVSAITFQKRGLIGHARLSAQERIRCLEENESLQDTGFGYVVRHEGRMICLPDYLHTETARKRFREEGIDI